MGKLKFGWSEVALLPEGAKVNLAGQFYERISDQVESQLTVTALAITCEQEAAILCSCDLVSTSMHLLKAVRQNLQNRPDIPADKVLISAIHTHTAPQYANRSDSFAALRTIDILKQLDPEVEYKPLVSDTEGMFIGEEAKQYIAARIAKAVIAAWDARSDGVYAPGFGRAAVGQCRRVCYDDGTAKMWGDTALAEFTELETGNDSGIELLFTYTPEGRLTGVVANVACPAQVLEHRSFISSDYWGKVKQFLREKLGKDLFVLGLCSPAGDQCPRDMIRWVQPETPINDPNISRENPVKHAADPSMFDIKGCNLVGRRIANEILYALEDVREFCTDVPFEHRTKLLTLPIRRVTAEQKDAAVADVLQFIAEHGKVIDYKDSARLHVSCGTIARYMLQQRLHTVDIEVHFMRLGDLAFATNPYELFLNYGNKIRACSPASQTFLIQLCCGAWGYLPTEKAEQGGHYSAYVSSGTVGHQGGDLLVQTTLQQLREMFQ
ncbi:MAG: hypothetical protein J6Q54_04085 [Oscillospiraceae bacterium]|nr:hypothetical protein [Oscillospiraceae bacterium]